MARRGDTHRLLRWLWTSRRLDARLARASLLPAAGLWRAASSVRNAAEARSWGGGAPLGLPVVGVGNLTVGDSGRAPVLIWMARHFAAQGLRPGIVVGRSSQYRAIALRHAIPDALVLADSDRAGAVRQLASEGAQVALLSGAVPPRETAPALAVMVIAAETSRAVRWPVPAGPWREGWKALERADLVIVTRRRAPLDTAESLARELATHTAGPAAIAQLGVRHLEGMVSGSERPASVLAGRRVVAASGSADPDSFVANVKATGAAVQVHTWQADGELRDEDVAWLANATRRADYVVVSEQDAVKLRDRWPARIAEPLVAVLDLTWESNGDAVAAGLDALVAPLDRASNATSNPGSPAPEKP